MRDCFLIVEVEDHTLRLICVAHSFEELQRRLDELGKDRKVYGIRGFY